MNHKFSLIFVVSAAQGNDNDTHERSTAASKQQAVDRRIEIQPAEDEDGNTSFYNNLKLLLYKIKLHFYYIFF